MHAFDANTGQELWGFVPPLLAGNLPLMINTALNTDKEGGSNAIYGVDGSPVVSNLFIQSPLRLAGSKQWRTILMIPYGRGGAGFSVLDVTDPDKPVHFYSIYNDKDNKKVHVLIARTNVKSYDYGSVPSEYDYTKLGQTWSSPRIARIPNSGAGDAVLDDDINVAIMGGGYDDEPYFFTDNFSQHPNNRYKTNGIRCVIISDEENTLASADTMIQTFTRDFYAFEPISDEVFNVYNGMFQYDPFDLNETVIEEESDINEVWSKELVAVSYTHLTLPTNREV